MPVFLCFIFSAPPFVFSVSNQTLLRVFPPYLNLPETTSQPYIEVYLPGDSKFLSNWHWRLITKGSWTDFWLMGWEDTVCHSVEGKAQSMVTHICGHGSVGLLTYTMACQAWTGANSSSHWRHFTFKCCVLSPGPCTVVAISRCKMHSVHTSKFL